MTRNSLTPFGSVFGGSDPVLSLHREMNRLFDDVLRTPFGPRAGDQGLSAGAAGIINANMNVSETENELRVSVELPGVTEQDIDVSLENDVLTIQGEKRLEEERGGTKENYHFVERSYGSFRRSIRLPFEANPDEVRASFDNGVLSVTVPKSAHQQRSKKIQVQKGQGRLAGEQPYQQKVETTAAAPDDAQKREDQPSAGTQPGAAH